MTMNAKKLVPLAAAAREVRVRFGREVKYRQLYNLVLDGRLTAEQVNGRYEVDIDNVGEVLGLTEAAA
jgi:hypothetical protein